MVGPEATVYADAVVEWEDYGTVYFALAYCACEDRTWEIAVGVKKDGLTYGYGGWGSCGYCHTKPKLVQLNQRELDIAVDNDTTIDYGLWDHVVEEVAKRLENANEPNVLGNVVKNWREVFAPVVVDVLDEWSREDN